MTLVLFMFLVFFFWFLSSLVSTYFYAKKQNFESEYFCENLAYDMMFIFFIGGPFTTLTVVMEYVYVWLKNGDTSKSIFSIIIKIYQTIYNWGYSPKED